MIKNKLIPLLTGTVLLFGCSDGPKTINVELNQPYGAGYLDSKCFSVNKDDQITITVDFSNYREDHNYYAFGFFMFEERVGDDYNPIDSIFDEISSFKYNEEDLTYVESVVDAVATNNTFTFYDYSEVGINAKVVAFHHINPSPIDKVTFTGKANNKYENICVDFGHKNFKSQI